MLAPHLTKLAHQMPNYAEQRIPTLEVWQPSQSELGESERPLTRVFIWGMAIAMLTLHAVMFVIAALVSGEPWVEILKHWDAVWYVKIVEDGYDMPAWAFYPLFPLLIRGLSALIPMTLTPQVLGTLVSMAMFAGFTWLATIWTTSTHAGTAALRPRSRTAWVCFCASPAAYIFHTCHTEALFLLLAASAFTLAARRHWRCAALLAGLCALTRNQGIVLAICTALTSVYVEPDKQRKVQTFLMAGFISLTVFSLFPLYQYIRSGDPLAMVHAQYYWRPEMTFESYFRTFWFGNAWQTVSLVTCIRFGYFPLLLWMGIRLWRSGCPLPLLGFVALCLALIPVSGELRTDFRYSAVLFPLYFQLGDDIGKLKGWKIWTALAALFLTHVINTHQYLLGHWAY